MSATPAYGRRRFLRAVGIAGLSSALVPQVRALAQTPAPSTPTTPAPAAADTAKAAAPAPPPCEPCKDAKALSEIIRHRYPHLSAEQVAAVEKDFDGDIRSALRLHAVKLANGDEPDFTFRA